MATDRGVPILVEGVRDRGKPSMHGEIEARGDDEGVDVGV